MNEQALPENGYFSLGEHSVDLGDHKVFVGGQSYHTEPKAMQVLCLLALNSHETVSRQQLMDTVWNGRVVMEDALTRVISQLRISFNDSQSRTLIQTVPKKGYRLNADVNWLSREEFMKALNPETSNKSGNANAAQTSKASQLKPSSELWRNILIALGACLLIFLIYWLNQSGSAGSDSEAETSSATQNDAASSDENQYQAPSLAFVPWRNLTGDPQNDYLAEMLPAELSVMLAKSERLSVVKHYLSTAPSASSDVFREFANDINLKYLVEGSITEANSNIRVLVHLLERSSGNIEWSEVYENDIQQLLSLNARIVSDLNEHLFQELNENQSYALAPTLDIAAYKAYLQGNYWWMNGSTSEWFARAEAAFTQATQIAPNFARAHGSLAFIYARHDYHDIYMPEAIALPKAKSSINQALLLDSNEINALLASALLAIDSQQFDEAQESIEHVLDMEPAHTTALYVYSELALAKEEMEKALTYANAAYEIDPLSPWINVNKAIVHLARAENEQAMLAVNRAIEIDKNYTWAYVYKAKVFEQNGQLQKAIQAMNTCMDIDGGSALNSIYLALLYTKTDSLDEAQKWFSHAASLYGDSPDARFWQNYLLFKTQNTNSRIAKELLDKVSLKTTRFFDITTEFDK